MTTLRVLEKFHNAEIPSTLGAPYFSSTNMMLASIGQKYKDRAQEKRLIIVGIISLSNFFLP